MNEEGLDRISETKINKILRSKTFKKNFPDGFQKNKVVNEVLDKATIMTLYSMLKSNIISKINGVIKAGKESVLFWAKDEENSDVALKVYLISTSNFQKRLLYVQGDPRFSKIKKGTRNIVYLWAQKEYRNLLQCRKFSIPVNRPYAVKNNVLALEFIGSEGVSCKTLLESEVNYHDYESSIILIERLYREAKLVHGDFSEYNVFKTENGLVLFDLGSAVDLNHPHSESFLKRDINNITNFFVKRGLTVKNPMDIFRRISL